ncbi:MAG: aminopeptidase [Planctomycetes bacterium]|nr:aminopeptidase [Planctomycetota bacterium]
MFIGARRRRLIARGLRAAGLVPLLAGCYIAQQGWHRLKIELGSRSLESVLEDPETTEETRATLRTVVEVRRFAVERLGLRDRAFRRFYDTEGLPVGILVSGCDALAFRPHTWWFPIVGRVPYKGFHDLEDAEEEAEALRARGLDIFVQEIRAYSTLGWLRDPFFSTLVGDPPGAVASLVIHEMTHDTIFVAGRIDWDENLASFVGDHGADLFLCERFGEDAEEVRAFRAALRFERRFQAYAVAVRDDLDRLYRSERCPEDKLREKEAIWIRAREGLAGAGLDAEGARRFFDGPANNAKLEAIHRYHGDVAPFEALLEEVGGRLDVAIRELKAIGDADDPERALTRRVEALRAARIRAQDPGGDRAGDP